MQSCTRALLLLLALTPFTGAAKVRNGVTPIGKVIDMLTSLQGKLSKEAEGETKAYEEQMDNCKFASRTSASRSKRQRARSTI